MGGPMLNFKKKCSDFLRLSQILFPHIPYMFNVQEIKKYDIGSGLDFQLFFFQ